MNRSLLFASRFMRIALVVILGCSSYLTYAQLGDTTTAMAAGDNNIGEETAPVLVDETLVSKHWELYETMNFRGVTDIHRSLRWSWGVRIGGSFSRILNYRPYPDTLRYQAVNHEDVVFGGFIQRHLSTRLSAKVEFLLNGKGVSFASTNQWNGIHTSKVNRYKATYSLRYIELPFLLSWKLAFRPSKLRTGSNQKSDINYAYTPMHSSKSIAAMSSVKEKAGLSFFGGMAPARLIDCQRVTPYFDEFTGELLIIVEDLRTDVLKWDASFIFGSLLSLPAKEGDMILFDFRYGLGLMQVMKGYENTRNSSVSVMVGYRF